MYTPIPKGSIEVIYDFTCHLPPVGYGVREVRNSDKSHTYIVERTDIIKRSSKTDEQYWQRTPLPDNYRKLMQEEAATQKILNDPDYENETLAAFRQQEWDRRLKGVWFYNKGVPTYITGLHYFYLNWWYMDGGYPIYRDIDRRNFYILQYCSEDPDCYGLLEVTGRRAGKTYRSGVWMYEYISRNVQANGGVQSKNDDDGKAMYLKAIMTPWTKLPEFFRPIFDTNKTSKPQSGLYFIKPGKRGSNADVIDDNDKSLNSTITYGTSKPMDYDGWALHRYISDECGKLKIYNINDRHAIVKPTMKEMGQIIGKMYYTTTVEDMEDGGGKFKQLWDESDQKERNELNQTSSGLYRVFTSAAEYEGRFDKYGFTDVIKNEIRIKAERASKKTQRDRYGLIRKYPLTADEAFRFTGQGNSLYDLDVLNDQLDAIEIMGSMVKRGNLVWKDGEEDTEVVFQETSEGRWYMAMQWPTGETVPFRPNNMSKRGSNWYPNQTLEFISGCDPFSHSQVQDEGRKSMGAIAVKRRHDPMKADDLFDDAFVCIYNARPATVTIFHEDMIKTCFYFGMKMLVENNKNGWDDYFKHRGYQACLIKLPEQNGNGIPGNDKSAERMVDVTEEYIDRAIKKVYFKDIILQWIGFDFNNRTKFDIAMAAGYCLMADSRAMMLKKNAGQKVELKSVIKPQKIMCSY